LRLCVSRLRSLCLWRLMTIVGLVLPLLLLYDM
jgi:hypothetical protein